VHAQYRVRVPQVVTDKFLAELVRAQKRVRGPADDLRPVLPAWLVKLDRYQSLALGLIIVVIAVRVWWDVLTYH